MRAADRGPRHGWSRRPTERLAPSAPTRGPSRSRPHRATGPRPQPPTRASCPRVLALVRATCLPEIGAPRSRLPLDRGAERDQAASVPSLPLLSGHARPGSPTSQWLHESRAGQPGGFLTVSVVTAQRDGDGAAVAGAARSRSSRDGEASRASDAVSFRRRHTPGDAARARRLAPGGAPRVNLPSLLEPRKASRTCGSKCRPDWCLISVIASSALHAGL